MEQEAFRISDHYTGNFKLMGQDPIIKAPTQRKALDKYLKQKGVNVKVRRSGDNIVHFGVLPVVIENGEVLRDGRGHRKESWYEVVPEKID